MTLLMQRKERTLTLFTVSAMVTLYKASLTSTLMFASALIGSHPDFFRKGKNINCFIIVCFKLSERYAHA